MYNDHITKERRTKPTKRQVNRDTLYALLTMLAATILFITL